MTVTITKPELISAPVEVVHIAEDETTGETAPETVSGAVTLTESGSVAFEADSFSIYIGTAPNGSELKRNGSALISSSEIKARIPDKEHFAEFIADNSLVSFFEEPFGLKEYEIREYISKEVGKRNGSAYEQNGSYALLRSMDRLILREMFNTLISKRVSIAKLSRITGLSRYFIKMALI